MIMKSPVPPHLKNFLLDLTSPSHEVEGQHLTSDDLLDYAEERLNSVDIARCDQHLENCPECAFVLDRILNPAPEPSKEEVEAQRPATMSYLRSLLGGDWRKRLVSSVQSLLTQWKEAACLLQQQPHLSYEGRNPTDSNPRTADGYFDQPIFTAQSALEPGGCQATLRVYEHASEGDLKFQVSFPTDGDLPHAVVVSCRSWQARSALDPTTGQAEIVVPDHKIGDWSEISLSVEYAQ
jgi:hypothetical protein